MMLIYKSKIIQEKSLKEIGNILWECVGVMAYIWLFFWP